jgi:hypothetical protein
MTDIAEQHLSNCTEAQRFVHRLSREAKAPRQTAAVASLSRDAGRLLARQLLF